jgi:ubiquitin C-terminal hydrolase
MRLHPSPLINRSVSCWLNVIIQSLGSCPEFCKIIKEDLSKNLSNNLFSAFGDYVNANINARDTSECSTVILNALNKLTRDTGRNSKLTQHQQCSLEFYGLIISALCHQGIFGLFRSYYIREVTCPSCHHVAKSHDAVSHIDICKNSQMPNYHPNNGHPKLLLDYLGYREVISSWECPECHVETHDVESVYRLLKPARIITFVFDKAADNSSVVLPPSISFAQRGTTERLTYHPVAVVSHYGTSVSGHYIVDCKRLSPKGTMEWYRCNDDLIREVASNPLEGASIFMAFYVAEG